MKRERNSLWKVAAAMLVAMWTGCGSTWARTQVCGTDIDNYLRNNGNYMTGTGAAYVKWGKYFNVDPRLMVGISNAESTLGKTPCGTNETGTWNAWGWFGGIGYCWPYFAPGWDSDCNRAEFADAPGYVAGKGIEMATGWEDGIFWVTRTIRKEYLNAGYDTVAKIRPRYCQSRCENWESNVNASLSALIGDPNQLDFPGESCTGDTSPPSVVFTREDGKGGWTNDRNKVVVEWRIEDSGGSGVKGFHQRWDETTPTDDNVLQSSTGSLSLGQHPTLTNGWHTAHVRGRDNAGNTSDDRTSGQYGFDGSPPTVTITSGHVNGGTYNSPGPVTWSLADPHSGVKGFGQAWDSVPPYQFNTDTGWLDLPEGTHTLHVHAWDNAGNDKDWTWTFTYQPQGTLSVTTISNTQCGVSGPVSVDGTAWGNAPQSKKVNTGSHTVSFGAVSGYNTPGNQTVTVNKDQTTNVSGKYTDTTNPIINVTAPAVNTCLPPLQTVSWTTTDICTAGLTVQYSWDGGTFQTTSLSGSLTVPDGTHTLKLKGTDAASNMGDITVGPFIVDTTPPAAPTALTVTPEHFKATLAWAAPAADGGCSGVVGYNVYRKRNGSGSNAKVNTTLVTGVTHTDTLANGVAYDYAVAAVDTFGREGAKVEATNKVVGKPGDMNGDGEIDIADVIKCINVINDPNASAVDKALADYNRDNKADAADVEAMKKFILGK
ncbi:MAG: hypothetical protein AUJ92_18235 [Armatimonadetes bacterium CG2_30_59_28]|nr:MAG: hypothetical protein AUJ92_18235 [Armatimonadetes bacterium CG2_30_59_28]